MTKAVLTATDVFSFGWIWASNRDACLDKQTRKICFFFSVGIWDTTAMLAKTERPFVMTNAMLAKTDRQAEPSKFLDNLRCDSLDLHIALDTIIVVWILGVKQICFLVGEIGYRLK